jgi:hypothetical protein
MNQSLGRIQRLYQDALSQGGNDSMEPLRLFKNLQLESILHYIIYKNKSRIPFIKILTIKIFSSNDQLVGIIG